MEALPSDIRNLPRYYVPNQIFICTCIMLLFFLLWSLGMFAIWLWRSKRHIHNYEYIVDHNIRRQFQHENKKYKQKVQKEQQEQNEILESQNNDSDVTQYSPELEKQQMVYNRQQSRLLEFVCLSVIVPININAFTCNIMELVAYAVSILLFVVFNIFRVSEQIKYLRLLFLFALIVAYLPFFIFKKQLKTF